MRIRKNKPSTPPAPGDRTRVLLSALILGACLLIGSRLPLDEYGAQTGLALGFAAAIILLWLSNLLPVLIPALILALGGNLLGFLDTEEILSSFGSPILLVMIGFSVIAMGAEQTNFARRTAYFLLRIFGQDPERMLFALLLTAVFLSAFLSNIATTILLGGLAAHLLSVMEERPKDSIFGKALMLLIPAGSMIGGMALLNGSPAINLNGLSLLERATGQAVTLSYRVWALFGIPCALLSVFPCWQIYRKCFRVRKDSVRQFRPDYAQEKAAELGPVSGAELRWIFYVFLMLLLLVSGMELLDAALFFTLLHLMPGLGTVTPKTAFQKLPVEMLLMCAMVPLFSVLFTQTGLDLFFSRLLTPVLSGLSPLAIMIFSAILMTLLNNFFVNASAGILSVLVSCEAPYLLNHGLNPAVILLPSLFLASYTLAFGTHVNVFVLYDYGYWEMKDPILPGLLFCLFCSVLFSLVVYLIAQTGVLPVFL